MNDQKDTATLKEIGLKLQNFRKKLALAVGINKITQPQFGAMFGGYNERQITSYETGSVEIPARLLYLIWKNGNSIDAIFAEQPISDESLKAARKLFDDVKVTPGELITASDDKRRNETTGKAAAANVVRGIRGSERASARDDQPRPHKKRQK